jgi:hypothetical protein
MKKGRSSSPGSTREWVDCLLTGLGLVAAAFERCSFLHCTDGAVMSFVGACSGSAIHLSGLDQRPA